MHVPRVGGQLRRFLGKAGRCRAGIPRASRREAVHVLFPWTQHRSSFPLGGDKCDWTSLVTGLS